MEFTTCFFSTYFVAILLMQMPVPISAQFTVHCTVEPLVATLGGQVEIHCHISPPQSAAHMEVRWFRNRYTQPVYLYQDGRDLYRDVLKDYVERTKLLKHSIGEGNVTLRIQNVVTSDAGMYHCLFQDGDFSEEAIVEIQIAAVGLDIQFNVNITDRKKIMVECNSEGWFPKPKIQWIDSNRQIIPPSSESYSQDKFKLFHISSTLVFKDNSKRSVTCYLQNPITGQEKWTNIKISGELFLEDSLWELVLFIIISVVLFFRYVYFLYHQPRNTGCLKSCQMLLFYLVFLALQFGVLSGPWNAGPISKVNIITMKEELVFFAVMMLFASMLGFLSYTLLLRGRRSSNQEHEV